MQLFKVEQGSSEKLGKYKGGNTLLRLILRPLSLDCGAVEINGGEGLKFTLFEATNTLTRLDTLKPMTIELGVLSTSTGWKVSAGRNIEVLAVGEFN